MFEMKRKQEEQKIREVEEKKAKEAEAKRKRLEEAEKKRQAMCEAMQKQSNGDVKPNFIINRKDGSSAALAGLGRIELIKTKEQLAEEKKIALGNYELCDSKQLNLLKWI
jgi:troponin T